MRNKTDANDAAMLTEFARTGFDRWIVVKSGAAQERRTLLAAREAAINARRNAENTIRGLLAGFGLSLPTQPRLCEARVRAVLEGHAAVARIIPPLLAVRAEALRQASALTKEMVHLARACDASARRMTIPGVGAVTASTFVATIDAPERFSRSRSRGRDGLLRYGGGRPHGGVET